MKRALTILFVASSLVVSLTLPTSAGEISLGSWVSQGLTKWQIDFPTYNATTSTQGKGASELYYPQIGSYITTRYESSHSARGYFSAEGGYLQHLQPLTGSDSDWDYTQGKELWYYGEFKTTGSSGYLMINWHTPTSANSEIFYGYSYRKNKFQMTQGLYTVYDYQPVTTQLPLLNSTYAMIYQGPHIGATTVKKITPTVSAIGSVAYSPFSTVQGHGWWNLRELDFVHTGSGQMMDAKLGLRYSVPKTTGAITIGYHYKWMNIFTGSENTSADISWNKALTIQQGLYVSGEFRF